ncbi:cytosol nonspecific dipeptidase [Saccharobesus litoralis]|uniref:Cytosol non-specific dipeptidase n=1 Tax=Saccharobesus litoralis TaxID=2172099 RepID=A0A2S0VSJ1_9ALTE|nr:aminoacyl-histidine dipeptidase [Saccharobesus litoralis]AWB67070.1 cytosol nonspecific dipeptidase [Saccharobesus litoralis]
MSKPVQSIRDLQPSRLWHWFADICAIPHPSKYETQLKSYISQWASQQGIEWFEDEIGNLILRKPATKGMALRKPVVIQAHLDMVPQANADNPHDFTRDPILTEIIAETEQGKTDLWVRAKGTTLGSDNGIGMASALAVLAADDIAHPALEVLLTVDEEAGMTGAFGLQAETLQAEVLINTDSEQEGEVYMGCAGGVDANFSLPVEYEPIMADVVWYRLAISGLRGGHSGVNIELGRANAIKLLARFFYQTQTELQLSIAQVKGGSLRNAIPRESQAIFAIPKNKEALLNLSLSRFQAEIQQEFGLADPHCQVQLIKSEPVDQVISQSSQKQLIALLHACPNGVMRMSDEISGVVETSTNMGVLSQSENALELCCLIRSLDDSGRDNLATQHQALAELAGAAFTLSGAYPGWKPNNDSPIMAIVRDVYEDLYGHKPKVMVIHAGLECGLFKQPYPDMDMVSIGPTIRYPHSPDEKVNVRTVELYWQLLLALLKNIPEKTG